MLQSSQLWSMDISGSSEAQVKIDSTKARVEQLENALEKLALKINHGEGDFHVNQRVKAILDLLKQERAALAKLQEG